MSRVEGCLLTPCVAMISVSCDLCAPIAGKTVTEEMEDMLESDKCRHLHPGCEMPCISPPL